MGDNSIAAQTFKGSFFSIGSAAVTIVSGFVRSVILARLLSPEHFGAVALAMFFVSVLDPIRNFGFNQALIHRDTNIQEASATYFVLRVSLAIFVVLLTFLLTPLLRRLYPSQPEMVSALIALSCVAVVKAVNSTPDILLHKELAFKYLAVLDVSSSLAMTIVAPAMAWAGFGFWSLVGEQAIPVLVRAIGLWVIRRPWQFSLRLDKDMTRWYFRFGSFVFLSSSFAFLLDQFDDFWTGTALGATALGFYSRAYEFARYPRRVIGTPITRVFFPAYAKLQRDRLRLSKAYYRASGLIVRMGFLFSLVFALVVPEFIRIFIGAKWLPMVLTFRLMLLYTLLDPLVNTSEHLITAVGQPQILTKIRALQLICFVPTLIILARYFGIEGVAMAADLMLVVGLILMLARVREFVDCSLRKMFGYPTLGLLLGAGAALLISHFMPMESDVLSLLLKGGVASAVYIGFLSLSEYDEYRRNLQIIYRHIVRSQ
jgi:O-antigen/teichoic acid export membrane protein